MRVITANDNDAPAIAAAMQRGTDRLIGPGSNQRALLIRPPAGESLTSVDVAGTTDLHPVAEPVSGADSRGMRWVGPFRQWFFCEKPPVPESLGFGELVLDAGESLSELVRRLKWSIAAFAVLFAGFWAIPFASEMFLVLWILALFAVGIGSRIANRPADVRFYEYGLQGSLQSEGGNGWTNPPRTRLLRYDSLVSADMADSRVLTLTVQDPGTLNRAAFTVPIPPSKRSAVESLLPAIRRCPAHLTQDALPTAPVSRGSGW